MAADINQSIVGSPHTVSLAANYRTHRRQKMLLLVALLAGTVLLAVYAVTQGDYQISPRELLSVFTGESEPAVRVVVANIRLPRVAAALVSGWGLAICGLALQSLLKNPLASPFTLGITQGASFGAAVAIVVLGTQVYFVTGCAFAGAMAAILVILGLAGLKQLTAEAMILVGVALSALFFSGSILLQYLASEIELAMVVFWTFGDVARSNWRQIALLAGATFAASLYLLSLRWDLNAMAFGEETAGGLGVNIRWIRISGLLAVALVCSLVTAFHGVIAFMDLIAPHIARRMVGDDHRLLIPFSAILGALLLLAADTAGRVLIGSGALPVGVLTSFLGAPVFLYLLMRGYR